MAYYVIYDGNCNLCVTLVQQLAKLDEGKLFTYAPMQDEVTLTQFGITPQDCEMGMILIEGKDPKNRWQGSDAAEEIARLLPAGSGLVDIYRSLPGMKWVGDRFYEQIRDNRYQLFGKRYEIYHSPYPIGCQASSTDIS
jgi:predicted DCC family thiol-disulfide oxidoreductase YuxK